MNVAQTLAIILDFTSRFYMYLTTVFTRKLLHSPTYQRTSLAYSKLLYVCYVCSLFSKVDRRVNNSR